MKPFNGAARLKRIIAAVDRPEPEVVPVVTVEEPILGPLYAVYKRTLPVGINKPIFWNLPQDEAYQLATEFMKTSTDVKKGGQVVVTYYDVVRQDAADQMNIFWNPKPCVKPEGSDPVAEAAPIEPPEWVG